MTAPNIADVLESADKETLTEISRSAETYLQAQLTAAIAADQRALTMAGFIAAAIVVLIGGAVGFAGSSNPQWILSGITFAVAAALFLSLNIAIKSAKPSAFEFPGNVPSSWINDVAEGKSLARSLAEQCEHYDGMASTNNEQMEANARGLNMAVKIAFWSLVAGGAGFFGYVVYAAIDAAASITSTPPLTYLK